MANDLVAPAELVARLEAIGIGRTLAINMPPAVAAALQWRTVVVTGDDGQFDRAEVADLIVRHGTPLDDLRQALAVARRACQPSLPSEAYAATAPLQSVARRRAEADLDAKLAREVYAAKLSRFPADAIAEACDAIMERSPFWPALSELMAAVERIMAPRRQLVRALERAVAEADAAPKIDTHICVSALPSREQRRRDVIAARMNRGQQHLAADAELELAKLEEREPAEWATRPKPPVPPPQPRQTTVMDLRLEPLAIAARRRLMGEE